MSRDFVMETVDDVKQDPGLLSVKVIRSFDPPTYVVFVTGKPRVEVDTLAEACRFLSYVFLKLGELQC